jgi:acetyltransferase-like isoleucine patch superfamily enzyme
MKSWELIDAGRRTIVPDDLNTHVPVKIGHYCSLASGIKIVSGNHPPINNPEVVSTFPFYEWGFGDYPPSTEEGGVEIGNDVWIGQDVSIMDGVRIGDGVIVGANSLVTSDVPSYSIVGGNPAKHLRWRFELSEIRYLQKIEWWYWPEKKIIDKLYLLTDIAKLIKAWREERV